MDFSKLKYDPRIKGKMVQEYPIMKGRFPEHKDSDLLIRFAILFLDPFSPIAEERDIEVKKRDALKLLKEETWSDFYKHVATDSAMWADVMYSYFSLIHHTHYETWLTLKISFHQLSQELRGQMDSKDRGKASKDLASINQDIIELEAKLFPDEYTKHKIIEKIPLTGMAERFAQTLSQ